MRIKLETELGDIVMELNEVAAPLTSTYILDLVDRGAFDGGCFYRACPPPVSETSLPHLIQGGLLFESISGSAPKRLKDMGIWLLDKVESSAETGITHRIGTVSLARDLGGSGYVLPEFFICLQDAPVFDREGRTEPDDRGFPAFAHVVEGLDVAYAISEGETRGFTNVSIMQGQILTQPVRIHRVRRI